MTNHPTSSLFKTNPVDQRHPRAPIGDDRNEVVTVFDHAGNPHQHTNTNARELVRHMRFTFDAKEAEKRRKAPLEPVIPTNPELGPGGVLSRHSIKRTSTPVINGIAQLPLTGA